MKLNLNKMKLISFSTIVFTAIVLCFSCGGPANNNAANTDSTANAVNQADSVINLTSFSSIPDSLAGCSCIFSESENKYNANSYLYFDDLGTVCLISIDNKIVVLKPVKITEVISEFANDEYTAYIQNKKNIGSGAESATMTGELVVKNKKGAIITKKVYGVCGC